MTEGLKTYWNNLSLEKLGAAEADAWYRVISDWCRDHQRQLNQQLLDDISHRMKQDEPLQYILSEAWFYSRPFAVSPDTLIPRPETEELCYNILQDCREPNLHLWDICTGSGCIGITLLAERPGWTGLATDISDGALEVARTNAAKHGVSSRLQIKQEDFLTAPFPATAFGLIVSNPPYVARSEARDISAHVLEWEPDTALFPESEDVLIFYRKLAALLAAQPDGTRLWAEINPLLAEDTLLLFTTCSHSRLVADMSGKQRFIQVIK